MALVCAFAHTIGTATPAGAATTIHVPADQPTIAAAMAAAANGDTIEVAPGTYAEQVNFTGKDVRVVSAGGPAVTTIDPPETDEAVTIGPGGAFEGFTVTGAATSALTAFGAGSLIAGNRFAGNGANIASGAVISLDSASPSIIGNHFTDNSCGSGEIMRITNSGAPLVANNVFVDNPCQVVVSMITPEYMATRLINNTIVGTGVGVGIHDGGYATYHVIRNNIIFDLAVGIEVDGNGPALQPVIQNNLLHSNGVNYAGLPDKTGTDFNIVGDPQFISQSGGDFRLAASSPAVDAGSAYEAPDSDFDGSPRPLDGPDADLDAEYDIGAFERDGTEPPTEPQTGALDTGWSADGVSTFPSRYSIALAPTSDGGTYVGSWKTTDGNGPMRVSKFTPTGAPAPGWGSAGYVLRAFQPGGTGISFPTEVVPAGIRITVVGEHYGSTARLGVARLRSDGTYDTTFSGDGRALYKVFPGEHAVVGVFRAEGLTGGKLGLAAYALDYNSSGDLVFSAQAVLRLNANGTLDTTFSGDGVAVVPNSWSDIRWMPNGGSFVGNQGSVSHQVRKLLPSGQLDRSFSGDGVASAACGSHKYGLLAIDPSGRPVLACSKPAGTTWTLAMYRFTTSGGFDTTYSGDGKTLWSIPNAAASTDKGWVNFDATAKPWVAAGGPGATKSMRLYSLDSSGNPDATLNGDGTATVTIPWNVDPRGIWRGGNRLFITTVATDVSVGIVAIKVCPPEGLCTVDRAQRPEVVANVEVDEEAGRRHSGGETAAAATGGRGAGGAPRQLGEVSHPKLPGPSGTISSLVVSR